MTEVAGALGIILDLGLNGVLLFAAIMFYRGKERAVEKRTEDLEKYLVEQYKFKEFMQEVLDALKSGGGS